MEYPYRSHEQKSRTARLMIAAMLAKAMGVETDEDAIYRMCVCDFCAKGVPLVNGKHVILGAEIPCDATQTN